MIPDKFIELYYGKYQIIDLHNLTKENAKSELVCAMRNIDIDIKSLVIVHGYHNGTVIRDMVRNEFHDKNIKEKVNLDAGRTIFVLKS